MSPQYDNPYEIERMKIIKRLIMELGKGAGKNALDIGCAEGFYSRYLCERGYKTTGVDMSSDAINSAKISCSKYNNTLFKLADLETYDFQDLDISFDAVLCLELIEHIKNRGELIRHIVDKMNKKGKIIISTPNILSIEGVRGKLREYYSGVKFQAWEPTHLKIFNSFEFIRFLKNTKKLKIIKKTGYWYSSNYWYTSKKHSNLRFRLKLPINYTSMPLINMFGFNIIVVAERI